MKNISIEKIISRTLIWGASCCLILSFVSCKKFLDRTPLDQVSEPEFWKTPQQLDAYIVGKYDWLPGQLGANAQVGYYADDVSSDNMVNGLAYNKFLNGNESAITPASGGAWNWGAIREINIFFDNYKKCTTPFATYQQTYGEACFLKALRYHQLVMALGDVPWYSNSISMSDQAALQKARDPRALVVDSIMGLINQSITYLKPRASVGVNRINRETALIYKSRVALFEASWSKYHAGTPSASSVNANKYFQIAIDAFNTFKTDYGFTGKLYTADGPTKSYYNLFGKFDYAAIPEVTLSKSYSVALGVVNGMGIIYQYAYGGGNSYTLSLAQSYLKNDGTSIDILSPGAISGAGSAYLTDLANKLDPRFKQSVFIPGDPISNFAPYVGVLFTAPQAGTTDAGALVGFTPKKGHNVATSLAAADPQVAGISFRIPELMLNYVEAYVELNGTFPNLSDNIDLLRQRVGMPTLTSVKPVVTASWPNYGYPVSDAIAIVRQERRVELAGEGYRTNDWKRWRAHALFSGKRPRGFLYSAADYGPGTTGGKVVYLDANGYTDPYKNSLPGSYQFSKPDRDYLSPLPMDQLILNKKLVQNPNWDKP